MDGPRIDIRHCRRRRLPSSSSRGPRCCWIRQQWPLGPSASSSSARLQRCLPPLLTTAWTSSSGFRHRPSSSLALAPTSTIVLADIQSFRDGFRALFLPGFAIATFSLPLILIGLLANYTKGGSRGGMNGRLTQTTTTTTTPPPLALQSLSAVLLFKLLARCISV